MIPQADTHWFESQTVWSLVFFSLIYCCNQFAYTRVLQKRKKRNLFENWQVERLKNLNQSVELLENELKSSELTYTQEKALITNTLQEKAKKWLYKQISIISTEQEIAETKDQLSNWIVNLKLEMSQNKFVDKFIQKANEPMK